MKPRNSPNGLFYVPTTVLGGGNQRYLNLPSDDAPAHLTFFFDIA